MISCLVRAYLLAQENLYHSTKTICHIRATQTKISQKLGLVSHGDEGLNDSVKDNGHLYHWMKLS